MTTDCVRACDLLQWDAKNPRGTGWASALVAWQRRHALPHGLLLLLGLHTAAPPRPHVFRKRTRSQRMNIRENMTGFTKAGSVFMVVSDVTNGEEMTQVLGYWTAKVLEEVGRTGGWRGVCSKGHSPHPSREYCQIKSISVMCFININYILIYGTTAQRYLGFTFSITEMNIWWCPVSYNPFFAPMQTRCRVFPTQTAMCVECNANSCKVKGFAIVISIQSRTCVLSADG